MEKEIRKRLEKLSPSDKLDLKCVQRIVNELKVEQKDVLLADAVFYYEALGDLECPDWLLQLPRDVKDEITEMADIMSVIFPEDMSAGEETSSILDLKEVKELLDNVKEDPLAFIIASEEYQLSEAVVRKVAEITGKSILEIFLLAPQVYSMALMKLEDGEEFFYSVGGYFDIRWIKELELPEEDKEKIYIADEAEQVIAEAISLEQAHYDHSDNMEVLLSNIEYGLAEASDAIKSNPEAVLKFVKKFGTSQLSYASDTVKSDRSVLLAVAGMPDFDIEDLEPEVYEALQKIVAEPERCHTGDSIGSGVNPREGVVEEFISAAVEEKTPKRVVDHITEKE